MNISLLPGLLSPTILIGAVTYLIAGVGLGALYFHSLRENARLFLAGAGTSKAIVFMIGRFVLLGGFLFFASLEGALPLLAMAFGVFVGRTAVLRRVRRSAP